MPMPTEVKKTYNHGFDLSETELRRLVNVAIEQLKKVPKAADSTTSFKVRFRNGAITETPLIDELIQIENIDSSAIEKLDITVASSSNFAPYRINITFVDADKDRESWTSIRYEVKSEDRDWAFVTSGVLEERFRRVKRISWSYVFNSREFTRFTFPLLVIAVMTAALFISSFNTSDSEREVREIASSYQNDSNKDPIEAVLLMELAVLRAKHQSIRPMPLVMFTVILLFVLAITIVIPKLLPSYNFLWGDYVSVVAQKHRIASFLGGGIGLTLLISIVVQLITNWFTNLF